MSEGFVPVEGGRVWFRSIGSGPGVPILYVHGGPGSGHGLGLSLAEMGGREFFFYDQLGCGRSDRCTDDSLLTLERFVDEIDHVRTMLDLDQVHVHGSSWGSTVAAAYAARRPAGLRSAVLASPLISTPRWVEDARRLKAELPDDVRVELERHERDGFTRCPEYTAAMLVFLKRHLCRLDPWPEVFERSLQEAAHDIYEKMWGPSEFHPTGTLIDLDLTPLLPRIEVPVLFVCGEHDEATPSTVSDFATLVPKGRFEVIDGASHTPLLERPDRLLPLLRAFFEQHD